jgi:hypothetical protein
VTGLQETWRNTRWFKADAGAWVSIDLAAGANLPADPWDPQYHTVFVVPPYGSFVDGILDLSQITEIRIIALSMPEDAQNGYSEFDLWVDAMTVE